MHSDDTTVVTPVLMLIQIIFSYLQILQRENTFPHVLKNHHSPLN